MPPGPDGPIAHWQASPPESCPSCPPRVCLVSNSASPELRLHDPFPHGLPALRPLATRHSAHGSCVGRVFCDHPTGHSLLHEAQWWPAPRVVAADQASAAWVGSRCPACGEFALSLTCLRPVRPGTELTVATAPAILSGLPGVAPPFLVSFDGGARELRGSRVAGAGAALWGSPDPSGARRLLAEATAALPGVPHAQEAEAWGCAIALRLLSGLRPTSRLAVVVGDNLSVVRHAAGIQRLRRPAMHAVIDEGLRTAHASGWSITWWPVRRRLNAGADALATRAVYAAAALRHRGRLAPAVEVR